MTNKDFIKSEICRLSYSDAGNISANAVLAVAFVLRNRVNAGWGDWLSVLNSRGDFLADHDYLSKSRVFDPREPVLRQVIERIDGVYDGSIEDKITAGGLYYADITSLIYNPKSAFGVNIVGKPDEHPRVAQVGNLTIFK